MANDSPSFRVRSVGDDTVATPDAVAELVEAEARPSPEDRPWLVVNMISSLDGAVTVDGRSGGLGGPADKVMFRALRGLADAVLVGAGTIRAEGYGPPVIDEATRARRSERGSRPVPTIAVLTRSGDLDPESAFFTEAEESPIVYTTSAADSEVVLRLKRVADVVMTGTDAVDLGRVMTDLRLRKHDTVLVEGGPSLNGDLLTAGLVDELCVTLAPLLVGGDAGRIVSSSAPSAVSMHLDRVLEADDALFLRYLRAD